MDTASPIVLPLARPEGAGAGGGAAGAAINGGEKSWRLLIPPLPCPLPIPLPMAIPPPLEMPWPIAALLPPRPPGNKVTRIHGSKTRLNIVSFKLQTKETWSKYLQWNHEFHETCHSITFHFMKIDSKRFCDTTTPESIHTKDESKRGSAFAFIFGVNWPVQWM